MPDSDFQQKLDATLALVDPVTWIDVNKIQLFSGPATCIGREYEVEPLQCQSRRQCCRKATQGGWTTIYVFKTTHGLIHGQYPLGALYLFPTGDDVSEFSRSRFKSLLVDNPSAIGAYVKDTDSVSIKRIGQSYLYLRGARLSQKIDPTTKESGRLRSISVDVVVFDECDLMDESALEKARGRMGDSLLKQEIYLSNPTIPDYGIDKIFQQSDQRYWFRKCVKCGEWTSADQEFPTCVHLREDRTGYIACKKCGAELGLVPGRWVPAKPENSKFMTGWHWSRLISSRVDPAEVLKAYQDPPEGNIGDVYRLRLGLPYIEAENRLTKEQVFECCGSEPMYEGFTGPAAMGVDVGNTLYVVIGYRTSRKHLQIIKMARVSDWNDVHDLAKRYGVKSAVVDLKPEGHKAREFQKKEPYLVYLCDYSEHIKTTAQWNQDTKVVKVNRTEVCDATHELVATPGKLTIPRLCEEMKICATQMSNLAKVLETNELTGARIYRYRKLGDDHYYHATNYFELAAEHIGVAPLPGKAVKRPILQSTEYYV